MPDPIPHPVHLHSSNPAAYPEYAGFGARPVPAAASVSRGLSWPEGARALSRPLVGAPNVVTRTGPPAITDAVLLHR